MKSQKRKSQNKVKQKARSHQKRVQQRAVKEAARKKLNQKAKEQVRRYLKGTRRPSPPRAEQKPTGPTPIQASKALSLDDTATFAYCDGVGECCKNRPIFVEPSDVFRIMKNTRAREKFNLITTSDLYPKDKEPGPLAYYTDKQTHLPFCGVHRVEMQGKDGKVDQVCPFFEMGKNGPECILGEDRLTQCKADPVCRLSRLNAKRRLCGWDYGLIDQPCLECDQAADDKMREEKVEDWLISCGMEERLMESDLFHGFIGWLQRLTTSEFHWKFATVLLFDWHRYSIEHLLQPLEEVLEYGPQDVKTVFIAARTMTEAVIARDRQQEKKDDSEGRDSLQGNDVPEGGVESD